MVIKLLCVILLSIVMLGCSDKHDKDIDSLMLRNRALDSLSLCRSQVNSQSQKKLNFRAYMHLLKIGVDKVEVDSDTILILLANDCWDVLKSQRGDE